MKLLWSIIFSALIGFSVITSQCYAESYKAFVEMSFSWDGPISEGGFTLYRDSIEDQMIVIEAIIPDPLVREWDGLVEFEMGINNFYLTATYNNQESPRSAPFAVTFPPDFLIKPTSLDLLDVMENGESIMLPDPGLFQLTEE